MIRGLCALSWGIWSDPLPGTHMLSVNHDSLCANTWLFTFQITCNSSSLWPLLQHKAPWLSQTYVFGMETKCRESQRVICLRWSVSHSWSIYLVIFLLCVFFCLVLRDKASLNYPDISNLHSIIQLPVSGIICPWIRIPLRKFYTCPIHAMTVYGRCSYF